MDEIEQRLTDALALEAASIAPADATWTGRSIRGPRRAWTITLAAAAVVAIIVGIGLTVRGSKTQQAFGTGSSRTPDCTGGWTSNGSRVIQKSGTTTSVGLTAVTFFAGGTPPAASLCALTIGADQKTTANGGTVSDGSALGYLSSMTAKTGEKSYLIGAFAAPTSRVTFTDEALGWTLSIDATTAGLNELGNGWYGYVVLTPAVKADITVQAYAFNTAVIDERQVTVGDGSNPASATKRSLPAMTSAGSSHIPAACNHSDPAYAISDVGATQAFVVFRVSPDARTMCFFDGSAWSTAVRRDGALRYLGYSRGPAGPSAFGAFAFEAADVTTEAAVFNGGSSLSVPSRSIADGLTFFVAPADSPTIVEARTVSGSSLSRVTIGAAPAG